MSAFAATAGSLLAILVLASGCNPEDTSATKNLVRLKDKKNIATFFMGDMSGIPGVAQDPPNMKAALEAAGFGFEIRSKGTSQSAQSIIADAAQAAVDVGYDGGTYFFYFSGHGAQDGSLSAGDRQYMFSEVAEAIKAARKDPQTGKTRALSRGIVFADACFSGNLVDGQGAVGVALRGEDGLYLAPGAGGIANLPDMNVGSEETSRYLEALNLFMKSVIQSVEGTFDELIVIASSRKTETSGDTPQGGVGTSAFIAALRAANDTTTIGQVLASMESNTRGSGQTPVSKTVPETLRNEPIKGADQSGGTGSTIGARPDTTTTPATQGQTTTQPSTSSGAANTGTSTPQPESSEGGSPTDTLIEFMGE